MNDKPTIKATSPQGYRYQTKHYALAVVSERKAGNFFEHSDCKNLRVSLTGYKVHTNHIVSRHFYHHFIVFWRFFPT